MEIDQLAATIAHEICNAECFAFTGEGPKPHSRQCQAAANLIASAMRKFGDPMQAEIERLRAVAEAAKKMPRWTPKGGAAGTKHTFQIAACDVWALDTALKALGDQQSEDEAKNG